MKDFASFQGANEEKEKSAQEWLDEAQSLSQAFHGKSENDLMRAIYERAKEGKRNGTLTNEQIDAFCVQLAPLLDGAKRKKLEKIVKSLKEM